MPGFDASDVPDGTGGDEVSDAMRLLAEMIERVPQWQIPAVDSSGLADLAAPRTHDVPLTMQPPDLRIVQALKAVDETMKADNARRDRQDRRAFIMDVWTLVVVTATLVVIILGWSLHL